MMMVIYFSITICPWFENVHCEQDPTASLLETQLIGSFFLSRAGPSSLGPRVY